VQLDRSSADSSSRQQLCYGGGGHLTSADVTASSVSCYGNGDDSDWSSQRWRHWQQMTMMNGSDSSEQQTLV